MIRLFNYLAVAFVTFGIGLGVTSIRWLYRAPDAAPPEITSLLRRPSCFPGLSVRVEKSADQIDFFPVTLSDNPRNPQFVNKWYSRALDSMNEQPLAALENEDESYRFLWLRTFHQPVAIHVWRKDEQHFMVVKRLNGKGGYVPGTFDLYWSRSISENDWDAFMTHLESASYWLTPTKNDRLMFDGAQWVMEGYREGRYHVVDRQSPDDGAYREACMYLLRRSGLLAEITDNEVY